MRELIDGCVHLVLGQPGLVFSRAEFVAWLALLEAAAASPPGADGTLTVDARRAVSYLATHERFVVQFDQFVITVSSGDLARLAALCRKAAAGFAAAPAAQPLSNESIARN